MNSNKKVKKKYIGKRVKYSNCTEQPYHSGVVEKIGDKSAKKI